MPVTGKYLDVMVNGSRLVGNHKWSVNEVGDRLDTVTGADKGRGNPEVGVIDTKISIDFYLDIVSGQFTFIRPGALLESLSLFLDDAVLNPVPLYLIELATVFSTNVVGQVRDKWVVTAEIEANGDVITTTDP